MRHARFSEEENSEDAFLDVVANVVGVLIILIMLVGAQASRSVLVTPSEKVSKISSEQSSPSADFNIEQLRDELQQAQQAARTSQRAIQEIATRVVKIDHESQAYDQQRVELAMHRSLLEEDLQRRKEQLDGQKQREFDVQRQLVESSINLDKLSQEQIRLVSLPEAVTEVECVPTPLAKVVEGKSIHLRLSKGLVSVVPFEELMEEVQFNLEGTLRRLQNRGRTVETYGPIDGYRLKLTMAQRKPQGAEGGPLVGQMQRVKIGWVAEILPVSSEIGQNVEQSLLPGGVLHKHLVAHQRQKPAVVVWLYTDSFDEFRPLKRVLWERGFSLATRPMRLGSNIKASPEGTRAAAQ